MPDWSHLPHGFEEWGGIVHLRWDEDQHGGCAIHHAEPGGRTSPGKGSSARKAPWLAEEPANSIPWLVKRAPTDGRSMGAAALGSQASGGGGRRRA